MMLTVCALTTLSGAGCVSPKPLRLKKHSRNIVVHSDRTLSIDKVKIDFRKLRSELVSRMIFEQTPVTVHVHKDVPAEVFETILNKLKQEGYTRVSAEIYRD